MADRRELEAIIDHALKRGADVTIVTISAKSKDFASDVIGLPEAETPAEASLPASQLQPAAAGNDGTGEAVLLIEPASGRILDSNAAARHLLSDATGAAWPQMLAEIDGAGRLGHLVGAVAEAGRPAIEAASLRSLDGRIIAGEVTALRRSFRGSAAVQLILTARPAASDAEGELRRALDRALGLIDGLPDPCFLVDAEGRIGLANAAAGRLFGRAAAALGGEMATAFFAPADRDRLSEGLNALSPPGEAPDRASEPRRMELAATGPDGHTFAVEVALRAFNLDGARFIVLAMRDLTAEREAATVRAQALGRFHQAERLEALGRLAGGIAADVNNILGSILGYADLALDDLPPGHKGRGSVEQVLKAGRRGKVLVRQMLAFGRGEKRAERRIRLDDLVRQTLEVARPSLAANVVIEAEVTAKTAAVMGDEGELHQVILNLVRNAGQAVDERRGRIEILVDAVDVDADFAAHPIPAGEDVALAEPPGGTGVSLSGESDSIWAHAFVGRLEAGPYVRLTVADNGAGMDRATLAHIFEPFFTTRKVGEGSGLGLAVVHGIVIGANGAILVTSALGKGTRFEIFLPRSYRAAEMMAEEMVPAEALTQRVLVVDDEPDLAELSRRALERLGVRVDAMSSGAAALEAFRANPNRWNLIIADQVMPGMTGEALSRELLRVRPDLPIILCSGYPKTITLERIKAAGIREFVMKPVDVRQLAKMVQQVLEDRDRARA